MEADKPLRIKPFSAANKKGLTQRQTFFIMYVYSNKSISLIVNRQ